VILHDLSSAVAYRRLIAYGISFIFAEMLRSKVSDCETTSASVSDGFAIAVKE